MQSSSLAKPISWIGRSLSILAIMFLTFDTIIKIIQHPMATEATVKLGYIATLVQTIGVIELVGLALYAFPRTAVLGAILMTGHLGGAVATHLRAGSDTFSLIFPFIIGAFIWGGLYLRNQQLRTLVPIQR